MCSPSVIPVSDRLALSSASFGSVPRADLLPIYDTPNHALSSARMPITRTSCGSRIPFSMMPAHAINPEITPAAPSKFPPWATESMCEPITIGGAS